ncbi:MAG: helix-turn-helix domain-containing protein [Methyloligellaceae bacterium]
MPQTNLTERELQCLYYTACGLREREIAELLGISPHTTRVHMVNAKKRLGARNKTHSVMIALLSGKLDLQVIRKDKQFIGNRG